MKIGLIGNYGATNVGDDAILKALSECFHEHELTVFSAHPVKLGGKSLKFTPLFPLGIRSFFRHGLKKSKTALSQLDCVILGGGGLFQDDRLYACFLWAWQVFWVKRLKKPLLIVATGVGPLNTWWGRRLTKWAFQKADDISVRDQSSRDWLESIGVTSKIHLTADPAFSFLKQGKPQKEDQKGRIVISIRPWLNYNDRLIRALGDFLNELKAKNKTNFVFVAMQSIKESDLQLIKPLLKKVEGELIVPQDFDQLLEILGEAEFVIGMRYHVMIAALIAKTPLLSISYSPKTAALFKNSPLEAYQLNIESLSAKQLKEMFEKLSTHQKQVKQDQNTLAHEKWIQFQQELTRLKEVLNHFHHKNS